MQCLREAIEDQSGKPYAIQAPSTTGQSKRFLKYLDGLQQKVYLIDALADLRDASSSSSKLLWYTPERFLKIPPRRWASSSSIIIVYEAHTATEAYTKLLYVLRYQLPTKLILLSTSMDWHRNNFFFNGVDLQRIDLHPPSLFSVDIVYHPINPYALFCETVMEIIAEFFHEGTCVVMLPSNRQCHRLAETIRLNFPDIRVFHSKMESVKGKRRLMCCTTTPSLPDVKLVIDSGRIYRSSSTRKVTLRYYSKSMAEQRKRLTGRTCSGTVVRLYSEEVHEDLQDDIPCLTNTPKFSLELFKLNLPAWRILDTEEEDPSITLKQYDCLTKGGKVTRFGDFWIQSEFELEIAHSLWYSVLYGVDKNPIRGSIRILGLIVLQVIRSNSTHFIHVPLRTSPPPQTRDYHGIDEFHTYINIFINVWFGKLTLRQAVEELRVNAVLLKAMLSLAQKTFSSVILATRNIPSPQESWMTLLSDNEKLLLPTPKYDWIVYMLLGDRTNMLEEERLTGELYDLSTGGQREPVLIDRRMMVYPPSFFKLNEGGYYQQTPILPLSFSEVNGFKFLQLWAWGSPRRIRLDIQCEIIEECQQRMYWRTFKTDLMKSIRQYVEEDVSFRPRAGNLGYEICKRDFESRK